MEVIVWRDTDWIETVDDLICCAKDFSGLEYNGLRLVYLPNVGFQDKYLFAGALRSVGVRFDLVVSKDENFNARRVASADGFFCVDVDGTLISWNDDFTEWKPRWNVIGYVNRLYDEGEIVVVYTARSSVYYDKLVELLRGLGVSYDFIEMNKLVCKKYVDDVKEVMVHPDELMCEREVDGYESDLE